MNFDAALLWVRSRKDLTDALDVTPEFLRTKHSDAGTCDIQTSQVVRNYTFSIHPLHDKGTVFDYRNWQLGLGRRFRSLKVWFVLRSYGISGFQKYIRQVGQRGSDANMHTLKRICHPQCIELNQYFASLVRSSPVFSLVTRPSFALTVFRITLESAIPDTHALDEQALNDLNRTFYARLSARRDIMLTQTMLNGTFCVRFAVGAARTRKEDVDKAWGLLQEEAGVVIEDWKRALKSD